MTSPDLPIRYRGALPPFAVALCAAVMGACSSSNAGNSGDGGTSDSSSGPGTDAAVDNAAPAGDSGTASDSATPHGDSSTPIDAGKDAPIDSGSPQPVGNIPGTWTLAFDDEFNGTTLDTNTWTTMNGGGWGSTTCNTANVSVSGGNLVLTLASASSGGCACTGNACAPAFGGSFSTGSGSYNLPVGAYTEARVNFPGSGMAIYNWPAWWTSGPGWPAAGEHDIAEGLGPLTVTYHSPSGAHGQGSPAGSWANSFHVYGLYRKASSAEVYYDGKMVASYATDDDGAPQSLFFDVMDGYGMPVYGAGSKVLVDYVRAWQ